MPRLIIYLALMAIVVGSYLFSLRSAACPICLGLGMVRNRYFVNDDQPCGRCRGTGRTS
jgi:DnaJ-class molecular chaperone